MYNFKQGVCSFVGDWKILKLKGFKYYNHTRIVYMYEGINEEHKYSNIHIKKYRGIVSVSQLTGCLYQILTFIRDELDGVIPYKLYINKEKGIISCGYGVTYEFETIFLEEGLDVIYQMFLDGDITHNPELSLQ
ncbi:conserved hypothetical protein [Vibrio phage 501E54-1]|nr:conserved hypothetical protein [Vibrio phage 501E54-1]